MIGMDGARLSSAPAGVAPAADPAVTEALAVPPADLTDAERAFWTLYAPVALEQRTLALSTVAGFRELCQQHALKEAIAERIEKLGPASKRAEGFLRTYVRLAQRVDATLARFKLTPFGKAVDGAAATTARAKPNRWAAV